MSTSDNEAAAAFEASISVADDVEVAGDRIPKLDPALDSDLDLDLLEPARPGSPQQEQHQQSHPWFNAQPDGSDAAEPARSGSPQHEQHQQSHPWFNAQPAGLDDAEPAIATNGVGQGDGINQENGYDAENGNKQPNDRPGSRGSNGSPQNGNHVNGGTSVFPCVCNLLERSRQSWRLPPFPLKTVFPTKYTALPFSSMQATKYAHCLVHLLFMRLLPGCAHPR